MPRPLKSVTLNVVMPARLRDAINRGCSRRDLRQPEYLAWCVETAEKAAPLDAKLDCEPMPPEIRKQFEVAFRPALEKHTEHLTVEERLAAAREAISALVKWADQAAMVLRVRGGRGMMAEIRWAA